MLSKLRSAFNLFHKNSYDFIDITKYGHEQYQDIIINNKVVKRASANHPESELRYKIIQKVLDRYHRTRKWAGNCSTFARLIPLWRI